MKKTYAEYLLIKTRQDYDKIAEHFSSTRSFLWKELISLYKYIDSGDKVLDSGCGNGRLLGLFQDKEIEYIGVDGSKRLIDIAKEKYPEGAKFMVVEALNLPFPDNYFNKVFSIAVLHHIPSDEFRLDYLKEARRVLKPGGNLILTVWNLGDYKGGLWFLIKYTILRIFGKSKLDPRDVFFPWKSPDKKIVVQRYIHCFKKEGLEELVKKAGFRIKETGFLPRGKAKKANICLIAEK